MLESHSFVVPASPDRTTRLGSPSICGGSSHRLLPLWGATANHLHFSSRRPSGALEIEVQTGYVKGEFESRNFAQWFADHIDGDVLLWHASDSLNPHLDRSPSYRKTPEDLRPRVVLNDPDTQVALLIRMSLTALRLSVLPEHSPKEATEPATRSRSRQDVRRSRDHGFTRHVSRSPKCSADIASCDESATVEVSAWNNCRRFLTDASPGGTPRNLGIKQPSSRVTLARLL